jgi:hypothetical protein
VNNRIDGKEVSDNSKISTEDGENCSNSPKIVKIRYSRNSRLSIRGSVEKTKATLEEVIVSDIIKRKAPMKQRAKSLSVLKKVGV